MMRLEERLSIDPDGTVIVRSGKVEYGQGIRDAFARLVAVELAIDPSRVRVILGDTAETPWDMGTFGSLSVRMEGALLARAAAMARRLLEARAPLAGEIPDDEPLLPVEKRPPAPARERQDARAVVTGEARFVGDLRVPGMLRGVVVHPPSPHAKLRTFDERAARAIPGVVAVVHDGDFLGVVAERADQARAAVEALAAGWEHAPPEQRPARNVVLRHDADAAGALAGAPSRFEAEYETPHVANASIGTSAGLADVGGGRATLHAATQRPFGLRDEVAAALGLPRPAVRVIAERSAGSYGRNNVADAALEAARLSHAVSRPVLVVWSRADELRSSPCRPALIARIRVGLRADGSIAAYASDVTTEPHTYGADANLPDAVVAMTSGRNAIPCYELGAAQIDLHVVTTAVRTGALRSLAAAPNIFAIESAMDELAARAGADPLEYRLRHTGDPRLRHVLETVAERSGWAKRDRRSLGLACAVYNGTYIAEVAEIEATPELRLLRAFAAVDCGRLVDPEGARNQIEGGIVQGASWALFEQLRDRDGRIEAAGWDDYPIVSFRTAPRSIDVAFTDDGRLPPTGLGEPGVVPMGAALANAVAAATGKRIRSLPLRGL